MYLEQQNGFVVAGEAGELTGLLVLGQAYHPEVALVDWGFLGPSPEVGLSALLRISPRTKIVVMSGNPDIGNQAIIAGASSFVFKAEPPERLVKVIHETVSPP
jgi:DNA-binding NarL/FixJ family response regulator